MADSNEACRLDGSLWERWNLRVVILGSLASQVVLIISADKRKTSRNIGVLTLVWLAYLGADWIAIYAVGLISTGQINHCPVKDTVDKQLAAFWAPFLLLHLGGPDAITAFSLEDNELWKRHLFGLGGQFAAVVYIFIRAQPKEYRTPAILMFVAGACKYAERTYSLYRASLSSFKKSLLPNPDPGPNYAQFMEEYSVLKASNFPVTIETEKEPKKKVPSSSTSMDDLEYAEILANGYAFFKDFKGLVVDHMFSFHERNKSRMFFLATKPADAFKVMEVEFSFMYDALYTKYGVVYSTVGVISRVLCTALTATCLHQFMSVHVDPKKKIDHIGKIPSYILLGGALLLDLYGWYNYVFSDWSVVLDDTKESSKLFCLTKSLSSILKRLTYCKTCRETRRWSGNLYQHSFFRFCLNERSWLLSKVADFIGIEDILDELKYMETIKCVDNLKEFIFDELKEKAEKAEPTEIAKEVYSARGELVLLGLDYSILRYPSISSSLSNEVEYDESLLLWHIATEMCYQTSPACDTQDREFCKALSDYMLYLLLMKPKLMSAVAGIAQVRFQDTCEEARKFLKRLETELRGKTMDQREKLACIKLLDVKTEVAPKQVKGDRSQSLLFDACILAKDLNELGRVINEETRWKLMSRIWVELLSYAAGHCRPDVYARQLSEGGELISFVWLLMVHFGLGEMFRIEGGHARAKLLGA